MYLYTLSIYYSCSRRTSHREWRQTGLQDSGGSCAHPIFPTCSARGDSTPRAPCTPAQTARACSSSTYSKSRNMAASIPRWCISTSSYREWGRKLAAACSTERFSHLTALAAAAMR
ncbi:hypothetical protein OE88DRAFT_1359531 [Heliocybe sulcata]|uniref:Uncharacterized protein n=1 Tax=Heliocybe sulcata TaxID=5364 RepID=A0A5C3MJV1_9AGAM|nr:hypothetical protein OE88DRAFT_1359531 [Heliocybe sulcata]